MEQLSVRAARRLALARAGLLGPAWSGLPRRAGRGERQMRDRAQQVIERFGYLQLDTVAVAGARSHAIVVASRLEGFDLGLGERLLAPERPLFEYWGHEASWLPLSLWGTFAFRRHEFQVHPWWGDLLSAHPEIAARVEGRIRDEGPLPARALESRPSRGWWDIGVAKKVAAALWSAGRLSVRERRGFERVWDLTERVIPPTVRFLEVDEDEAIAALLLQALDGHGWAPTGTLAATFRLRNRGPQIAAALEVLQREGRLVRAAVDTGDRRVAGWIQPHHLELASQLEAARLRSDRGVLLSPFDPLLWDRQRTAMLFDFEQVLEIYTPAPKRRWGYFCLPVLAGDRLVARVDLATDRSRGALKVLSCHFEAPPVGRTARAVDVTATTSALERWAALVGCELDGEVQAS